MAYANEFDASLGFSPEQNPSELSQASKVNQVQERHQEESSSQFHLDAVQEASLVSSDDLPSKLLEKDYNSNHTVFQKAKNCDVVELQEQEQAFGFETVGDGCFSDGVFEGISQFDDVKFSDNMKGAFVENQPSKRSDDVNGWTVLKKHEVGVSEIQESEPTESREILGLCEKLSSNGDRDENSLKCCLKIEVIDDTALIETSEIGTGAVSFFEKSKKNNERDVKQETDRNKEKRPRRRGKSGKNRNSVADEKEKKLDFNMAHIVERKEKKKVYSRKELEELRYEGLEGQKKRWIEVYCGLGPAVQKEYDGLVNHNHHSQEKLQAKKHTNLNFNPRFRNDTRPLFFGEEFGQSADYKMVNMNTVGEDPASDLLRVNDENGCSFDQGECAEADDSDEDYSSIQKVAFIVTGEPDFDSGPPEDGLEYLRHVRWEAAQIPKVKVAKVDRSKLNKEQTVYMPQIPDIAKCPTQLMPLKEWEDAFLADFSELRLVLLRFEMSEAKNNGKMLSLSTHHEESSSCKLFESTVLENYDTSTADGSCQLTDTLMPESSCFPDTVSVADENDVSSSTESPSSSSVPSRAAGRYPTLSTILGMDSVARVTMLRKRINMAESGRTLCRDDCLWLFAMCAAVDTPLDANTSAALRSLLRKCASLRAEKSELDEEVIMLNMLATIAGRYFGQSEN